MSLQIGGKKKIFEGQYVKLWETIFFDKKGRERKWEWMESGNAVSIFPITSEQNIVLVRNFRIPFEHYVIEMPGGLRDYIEEADEDVAQRELFEETGYIAANFIQVHPWPRRPARSNGIFRSFIATGLTKIKDAVGDDTEDMSVIEIKMDELLDFYLNLSDSEFFDLRILGMQQIAFYRGIRG